MVRGCGMSCLRTLILIFNFIFVLSGIAIIALGAWSYANLKNVKGIMDDNGLVAAPVILIVVGCIVFLVAFLGCCGAMQESHCMLIMFSVCLFLILGTEIAAGVVGFLYRNKLETGLRDGLKNSMAGYYDDTKNDKSPVQKEGWDWIQKNLKCCGINGTEDWATAPNAKHRIPPSCCKDGTDPCNKADAYKDGCYKAAESWFKHNILAVGIAGIVIGLIEIFGIIFSCCLASEVRK